LVSSESYFRFAITLTCQVEYILCRV
jgi:hypothetical protein